MLLLLKTHSAISVEEIILSATVLYVYPEITMTLSGTTENASAAGFQNTGKGEKSLHERYVFDPLQKAKKILHVLTKNISLET
jgi:hypothetical protein